MWVCREEDNGVFPIMSIPASPPSFPVMQWTHRHRETITQTFNWSLNWKHGKWTINDFKNILKLQGVPKVRLHFVFCHFLKQNSSKMQMLGEFWKIQEICYMIGTRILKIDSEIAEIIKVKVATCHIDIFFWLCVIAKYQFLKWGVATLSSIISAISESIFKILVPIL